MDRDTHIVLTELLVLQAQGGNERAFTDLHELWAPHLRRMATIRVGSTDAADSVVQDTWVAIARGLHRLDDPTCFPRWAFRILACRCADWVRRRQVDRERAAVLAEQWQPGGESPGSAAGGDEIAALRDSIERLDDPSRQLLHLFYDMGFSVAEIADVLGVPPGTVKSRLHNLREKLRQLLERKTP